MSTTAAPARVCSCCSKSVVVEQGMFWAQRPVGVVARRKKQRSWCMYCTIHTCREYMRKHNKQRDECRARQAARSAA